MANDNQEEVIAGISDEGYDYTAGDRVDPMPEGAMDGPDENLLAEDLGLGGEDNQWLPGMTAREIEKSSFRNIKPGEYPALEVVGFQAGVERYTKVWMRDAAGNVKPTGFNSRSVQMIFGMPGDPNCQARDTFLLLPRDCNERAAFEYGFTKEKSAHEGLAQAQGFHARKLKQFLGALGFEANDKGQLDPLANYIANWLKYADGSPRLVGMTINAPQKREPKIDEETGAKIEQKSYPQPALFRYTLVKREGQSSVPARTAAPAPQAAPTDASNGAKGSKKSKKSSRVEV
jgi:hypothetical protein